MVGTMETAFSLMAKKVDFNILIFCSLLGALVYLISLSGGTVAYGKASTKVIKGRRSSLLSTSGLGIAIFIDDYFNCLTVGTVMRPITDFYKVSRAKLAYIIDSTAAPVCIIAPISSWAAAVGSSLKDTGAFESELGAFVATIPWNFYAIFSLLLVFFLCCTDFDFGPMRRAEEQASRQSVDATASGGTSDDKLKYNPNGTTWDMLVPLGALIVFAVMACDGIDVHRRILGGGCQVSHLHGCYRKFVGFHFARVCFFRRLDCGVADVCAAKTDDVCPVCRRFC